MITKIFVDGVYLMTVKDSHVESVIDDLEYEFDLDHFETDWSQEGYLFLVTIQD